MWLLCNDFWVVVFEWINVCGFILEVIGGCVDLVVVDLLFILLVIVLFVLVGCVLCDVDIVLLVKL